MEVKLERDYRGPIGKGVIEQQHPLISNRSPTLMITKYPTKQQYI